MVIYSGKKCVACCGKCNGKCNLVRKRSSKGVGGGGWGGDQWVAGFSKLTETNVGRTHARLRNFYVNKMFTFH